MSATGKMNIENYLKMSEPFASIPEADAKLVESYTAHHGNTSESQGMCAWALGEESKRRRKLSTQE